MKITVLFFAHLKDRAGTASVSLELADGIRIADLRQQLTQQYPGLQSVLGSALVSVNRAFAFDEDVLSDGGEVAFFPPVSGGSEFPTIFQVTFDPLDLDDLVAQITLPSTGAVCVFSGIVRGVTRRGDPHETTALEYEAYAPMAEEKMRQVADEMRTRWPSLEGIVVVQRIGKLAPQTPTVLIACSAAHRDTGVFEAARYGIDRLKEIVPIWKKEIGPDGEEWVEGSYHPTRGD